MRAIVVLTLALTSCASRTEILYVRAVKAPEETDGFLRMAQDEARVSIVGRDEVDTMRGLSGYILVHEQDMAELVRRAR